jgi:RND family efflux transporter MFP subunit
MGSLTNTMRRGHGTAFLAAALILPLIIVGCGNEPEGPAKEPVRAVKLLTLANPLEALGREFPGRVQATSAADLAFRVSGPLIEIPVEVGQAVEEGEIVARIDERDFKIRLEQAQGAQDEAEAQLLAMKEGRPEDIEVLKAALRASQAKSSEAVEQYKRFNQLFEEGVETRAAVDVYKKRRDVALADVEAAKQRLSAVEQGARKEDLDAMAARIEGLVAQRDAASAALADATLRAPYSGVIALEYVENRENVQANQPIVSLQDLSAIEIEIQVSETAMAKASSEMTITELAEALVMNVEFPAFPDKRFNAVLKNYELQADPITQTFAMTLIIKPPPPGIKPGMNATVHATVRDGVVVRDGTLFVPTHAVFSDASNISQVWMVDPDTMQVSSHPVEVGALSGGNVEILSGLAAGDTIATSAANALREGDKVRAAQLGGAN